MELRDGVDVAGVVETPVGKVAVLESLEPKKPEESNDVFSPRQEYHPWEAVDPSHEYQPPSEPELELDVAFLGSLEADS